jgi:hypothetical protein
VGVGVGLGVSVGLGDSVGTGVTVGSTGVDGEGDKGGIEIITVRSLPPQAASNKTKIVFMNIKRTGFTYLYIAVDPQNSLLLRTL